MQTYCTYEQTFAKADEQNIRGAGLGGANHQSFNPKGEKQLNHNNDLLRERWIERASFYWFSQYFNRLLLHFLFI